MLVLSVDTIESIFIPDEGIFAEVPTALEVTDVLRTLSLVLVSHLLLELEPLCL